MKRLAIASAAVIAMTGIGFAQESGPFNQNEAGNYTLERQRAAERDYYRDDRPVYRYRNYARPIYRAPDYYASYYGPGERPHRYYRHRGSSAAFSVIIGGGGYYGPAYSGYYGW